MEVNRYDRRVVDRYVEKGQITEKQLQDYLKNLPDEENNAQWVQMDLHDAEISEEGKGAHGGESGSAEEEA